jgi:ADP-ribose pyrophosphatase
MKVFLAEGLIPGDAHPEEDEQIELRLVKLSEVLRMIEKGAILDGKTLTSVLLFARLITKSRKNSALNRLFPLNQRLPGFARASCLTL